MIAEAMASQYRDDDRRHRRRRRTRQRGPTTTDPDAAAGGGPDATGGTVPNAGPGPDGPPRGGVARGDRRDPRSAGREKYRDQLPSRKGKLFVRDRIDLWFSDDFPLRGQEVRGVLTTGIRRERRRGRLRDDRAGPDGLITGAADVRRPRRPISWPTRLHGQTREHGRQGVEKFLGCNSRP